MYKADEISPETIDNVREFIRVRLVEIWEARAYAKLSNHKNKIEDP